MKPLTKEQYYKADTCLHTLLQCIYAAPLYAYGEREKYMMECHWKAAQCYGELQKHEVKIKVYD